MFSLFIELVQLLYCWGGVSYARNFDITDLVTNTFGGLIGYIVYIVFKPVIIKVLEFLNNKLLNNS